MKKIPLTRLERVVAVVPETCSGPGWLNQLIWVFIEDTGSGKTRRHAIQYEDCTDDMRTLFKVCEAAHSALIADVQLMVERSE
jgi:hypothetical protein